MSVPSATTPAALSKALRNAVSRGEYTTSNRICPSRTCRRSANGSAAEAGSVEITRSALAAARSTAAVSDHRTCSMVTPSREAAATTEPGPPKRRAATVDDVIPSSPNAASAEEAVARAPRTRALDGAGHPAIAQARLTAEAMPVTSVLKPARTPEDGTTVLTAPTALASGSIASSSGMTACLQGIVTDRPTQSPPRPATKPGSESALCSRRR